MGATTAPSLKTTPTATTPPNTPTCTDSTNTPKAPTKTARLASARPNACVLVFPTAEELAQCAPRNRMSPRQVVACVRTQYFFAACAFADPATDVVLAKCTDNFDAGPALQRLVDRGFEVVRVRDAGNAAADPATKVFVWNHTPWLQRCPVAVRVDLANVLAVPRVTLKV
jgi:hypothetical protein